MVGYEGFRFLHIGFGSLALLGYWSAAVLRKGSPAHKAVGKIYLLAMATIVVSSLPLTVRILYDVNFVFGVFLFYILALVIAGVWQAWRAVRDKGDVRRYAGPVYRVLAALNLMLGLVSLGLGLSVNAPLLALFSPIGILSGIAMLRFARNPVATPGWWMNEHRNAMIGNGVATHIAFLSIGLPRLLPSVSGPALGYAAWLGPVVIAVAVRLWLEMRAWRGRGGSGAIRNVRETQALTASRITKAEPGLHPSH